MTRYVVMGSTGTGKTTFAARLARKLNVPHIEGDTLIWLPGWQRRAPADFAADVERQTAAEAWVFDGCYSDAVMQPVWERAQTIIWLDYPRWQIHWQVFKRCIGDIISGRNVWNGNRETWKRAFFSRQSILLYSLKSYGEHRRAFMEIVEARHKQGQTVQAFRSATQAENFLNSLYLNHR